MAIVPKVLTVLSRSKSAISWCEVHNNMYQSTEVSIKQLNIRAPSVQSGLAFHNKKSLGELSPPLGTG